ncbi:porin [Massilia sp. 9096]|uniref:porin n=1 Tax=Massilia sp. 9096 TaxID=1500894 RepID=UPI000689C7BB|nr:porin [Massilia sp. 9096]
MGLLVANGSCIAQTSVTPYGILDIGVRPLWGMSANNAPVPSSYSTSLASGVDQTSVWGIKAQESLGGGWKALVRLEGGVNGDTGTSAKSDRLFDRHAWIALGSPYGTVALGRQPNLISDQLMLVDPLGKRFASFNPDINIAGLSNTKFGAHSFGTQYGPSGYADNFYRLDNTIKYSADVGPWQARAAYSAGEVAGNASAMSSHGVALAYQQDAWAVSGATMQLRSREDLALDAWSLGAALKLASWQFKTNFARNHADTGIAKTVSQRVSSVGVSRAIGHGLLVTAAWYGVRRAATGWRDDGFNRAFLYVEKTLGPRTTAYLEADTTTWLADAAGQTAGQPNDRHGSGLTLGLKQKF